jgi:hypothetical protein
VIIFEEYLYDYEFREAKAAAGRDQKYIRNVATSGSPVNEKEDKSKENAKPLDASDSTEFQDRDAS